MGPVPPDHVNLSRRTTTLAIASTFSAVATLVLSLRLYVRIKIVKQPSWDDWVIILAWVGMMSYLFLEGYQTKYGSGVRREYISSELSEHALKIVVGIEAVYWLTVNSVKVSILLLYLRFISYYQKTRKLIIGTILLLILFWIICEIGTFNQCRPLRAAWDATLPKNCINMTVFLYTTTSFHIMADLWILLLPIPTLWKIKRSGIEKVVVLSIFLVGGVTTLVSCARLYTIQIFTKSTDPMYDITTIDSWTFAEEGLGVICACVPNYFGALRPLFPKVQSRYPNNDEEINSLNERTVNPIKSGERPATSVQETQLAELQSGSSAASQRVEFVNPT